MIFFNRNKNNRDDNKKIEERYIENKALLLAYGSKLLGSKDKAEDAVHETFIAIMKNKEKYLQLSCSEFTKLAVVIMRNKCIDQVRKEKKIVEEDIEDLEYRMDFEESPLEEELIKKEEKARVKKAFDQLDPISQQLLLLKYSYGLSYKKIGQDLSMTPKHVETKLYRARQKLRKILGEEE